jgi:hypothetical protein
MARIRLGLESTLAVDKVHEQQQEENSNGEFDELYHELDQPEPEPEETDEAIDESEDDVTESDEPANDNNEESVDDQSDQTAPSSEDSESESDEETNATNKEKPAAESEDKADDKAESESDEETDKAKDNKETETALESCLCEHRLAMELLLESRYRFATESILDTGKSALQLGFKYAPVALKYVSKTIIKALEKTAKGLILGSQLISNYIKKRNNSYKHYLKKIESAKQTLTLIKEKELSIEPEPYTNNNVISKLKIADQLVLENTLKVAKTFTEDYFSNIDRNAIIMASSIRSVINIVLKDETAKPANLVLNIGELKNFITTKISYYPPRHDSLQTQVYKNQLPGDLMLIAHVMGKQYVNDDNLLPAYRNIKLFFGINEENLNKKPEATYLSIDEIETCLILLEEICHYGMSQESSFKRLLAIRKNINASFSSYIEKLLKLKDRITVRESMVEVITPSIDVLDKVYIGTTVQVDDYLGRLINASLVYMNDSMRKHQ